MRLAQSPATHPPAHPPACRCPRPPHAVFGIILPLGFFAQFAIGPLLDHYGTVAGLTALWGLGMLFSVVNLIPNLAVQAFGFAVFAAFRAFIFTNMVSWMSLAFGPQHVGKLIGVVVLCGGLVGLLQSPLLQWALAVAPPLGSFTPPNALMLGVMTAAGVFPVILAVCPGRDVRASRKLREARQQ